MVYLLNGRKTLLIPVLFTSYITAALKLLEKLHKVIIEQRKKKGNFSAGDHIIMSHVSGICNCTHQLFCCVKCPKVLLNYDYILNKYDQGLAKRGKLRGKGI